MRTPKILLVDDESDVVRALQFRLESAGYGVVAAANGAEAIARLDAERFDLILSDFMMPEMNGLELTRLVKSHKDWFETKIVLFSCNPDPEFRRRALELGALAYLPKTAGAAAILEKVAEAVPLRADSGPPAGHPEIASLARSLCDMLHLARQTGSLGEPALFALDAAQRVADDIVRLAEPAAPPRRPAA